MLKRAIGIVELVTAHNAELIYRRGYRVHVAHERAGPPEITEHRVPLL
ncbi:MAG: hypothetical protein QXV77_06490 [Candidatus Bathyarchaeia archaeon]